MVAPTPQETDRQPTPGPPAPRQPQQINAGQIARKRPEVAAVLRRLHNI